MKCSKCGAESPSGSKVCMMCGNPFKGTTYCPSCGDIVDIQAVFCPNCGQKLGASTTKPHQKQSKGKLSGTAQKALSWFGFAFGVLFALSYIPSVASVLFLLFALILMPITGLQRKLEDAKIKGAAKGVLLVALFFVGVFVAPTDSAEDKNSKEPVESVQKVSNETDSQQSLEEPEPEDHPEKEIEPEQKVIPVDVDFDTSEYMGIDAGVLFEYGGYLGGEKVVTVIDVEDVDTYSSMIKAKTSNNEGYFFSIVCEFLKDFSLESIEKGTSLTVAGTVKEKNPIAEEISFLDAPTVALENCTIIGFGEIAQNLKSEASEQRKICEQEKQTYESKIAAEKKSERDDYVSQCESVKYSDVERNPDNYDGKKVRITGKVIQVSEGWFDSVTLRVDCGGNVWLVSYSREEGEGRILENDSITCYGECTGVRSYTTVLGSQVTVPSLDMEYYD